MNVLAVDTGFGDVKVVFGDETKISHMYKFPSVLAEVKVSGLVNDGRAVAFREKNYYVGKDALQVQSSSIIDVKDYTTLEYFSPLFLSKVLFEIQVVPDIIMMGLSIAQISNSGHYKTLIEEFLKSAGISSRVFLVPQGAIAKLAVDKYGVDFPDLTKDYARDSSYVIADIGFNTLDVVHVVNGKTSSNLVRGIEQRGAVLIVNDLIVDIQKEHGITLNLSEAKDVLATGSLKRRGVSLDVANFIASAKESYIENLKTIIENEFGDVLDKLDNLVLVGGGSYILNPGQEGFVRGPKSGAEYYNAIGYYLNGLSR